MSLVRNVDSLILHPYLIFLLRWQGVCECECVCDCVQESTIFLLFHITRSLRGVAWMCVYVCRHLKTHLKLFQPINLVTRSVYISVSASPSVCICEHGSVCAGPFYKVYLQTYRDQSNLLSHKTEAQ